jgi:uncharacterized protein YndB with AHSA1/START domain
MNEETRVSDRVFTMERTFSAPREMVFRAWTEPEHLAHWWGPTGWTLPICTVDLRPGGAWHYCMRGPNGEESCGKATYREIVPSERLVYLDAFADAEGNVNEEMPQMEITVEFLEHEGKTKVVSHTEFASAEELKAVLAMGMVEGMNQTLDRLEAYLAER